MTLLLGIYCLARGQARGFAQFVATPPAFLASLAPLVAFPLVASLLLALRGDVLAGLRDFCETLAVVLLPPVLSFQFARHWQREAQWLRYATAFAWCQWVMPAVAALLMLGFATLVLLGLPGNYAVFAALILLAGYGLWLQFFLARHGLELSGPRAVLMVLVVNFATMAVVLGVPALSPMLAGVSVHG